MSGYEKHYKIHTSDEKNKKLIEKIAILKEKEIIDDFDLWVNKARKKFLRIGPDDCENNKIPLQRENFMKIISTAIAYLENNNAARDIYKHNKNKYIENIIKNYSRKN